MYAQQLSGDAWTGAKMDSATVDKMSGRLRLRPLKHVNSDVLADQQIGQLYELMTAIRKQELEDNEAESESGNEK